MIDRAADAATSGPVEVSADSRAADGAASHPWVMLPPGRLDGVAAGARVELPDDVHHHLARVLRRRAGSGVVASDGDGRVVTGTLSDRAIAVEDARTVPHPRPVLRVVQALGRRRKHDDVVRMLTELGVDEIDAVTTERCQVDVGDKADRVRSRWGAVAEAACSQARRAHRPRLGGPLPLATALDGDCRGVLVAHVGATTSPLTAVEAALADRPGRLTAVIGPEGGLADDEVAELVARGATAVSLGPTVLRTEHAGLVLAGIMAAAVGRMT